MKIDIIRKQFPSIIASDIVSVQPIQSDIFSAIDKMTPKPYNYCPGERVHNFIHGWQRFYGTQLISEDLYYKIKLRGL